MKHWFVQWLVFTWAVHFAAQVAFVGALAWYFGFSISVDSFLATHRPLAAFVLVVHFVLYLLTELLSATRHAVDSIEREKLRDD